MTSRSDAGAIAADVDGRFKFDVQLSCMDECMEKYVKDAATLASVDDQAKKKNSSIGVFIKDRMDEKYGTGWSCLVGGSGMDGVMQRTEGRYIVFKLDGRYFMVFKLP